MHHRCWSRGLSIPGSRHQSRKALIPTTWNVVSKGQCTKGKGNRVMLIV
uniref:Uncharacterized protein n=1 Tax=Anguilla anguilla TaxID=7936 RepID=A0A0E9WHG6_ANGAN